MQVLLEYGMKGVVDNFEEDTTKSLYLANWNEDFHQRIEHEVGKNHKSGNYTENVNSSTLSEIISWWWLCK